LPKVTVSNVVLGNESVDFDVDQVGVPVLVKVSYFPNWEVSGGKGPYRIAPNLMVVIPTSKHVSMNFGRSTIDYIAYLLSFIGVILLFVFKRYVPIHHRSPDPFDPFPSAARMAGADGEVLYRPAYESTADWTPSDPLLVAPERAPTAGGEASVDAATDPRIDDSTAVPTDAAPEVTPDPATEVAPDTMLEATADRGDAGPEAMLDDFEPPR